MAIRYIHMAKYVIRPILGWSRFEYMDKGLVLFCMYVLFDISVSSDLN